MSAADESRSDETPSTDPAAGAAPTQHALSVAESITYFRISAVASFVCGIGSIFLGLLTLSDVGDTRMLVGMGLSQIALGLVLLMLCVACVQLVSRLRAQQRSRR
jgi:hypothetical protein